MLSKHAGLRPRDDYADGRNFGLVTKVYIGRARAMKKRTTWWSPA